MEIFNSADQLYSFALSTILSKGIWVRPRGMKTLELTPFFFALSNPRSRCFTNRERRWSFPLALGEFCWHASGSRELGPLEYYAPRWRGFSDDGFSIRGSCYGYRIFGLNAERPTQWERVKSVLQRDTSSRRAVLYLEDPSQDTEFDSKDVPCASTVQFLVREGKLHAFVSMRSNDAMWGLPYDVFVFTMLQELLSCELNIPLGHYCHFAVSMHLYEAHVQLAKSIVTFGPSPDFEMPVMSEPDQLPEFLRQEKVLRERKAHERFEGQFNSYWSGLLSVLEWFRSHKRSKNETFPNSDLSVPTPYTQLLDRTLGKATSA